MLKELEPNFLGVYCLKILVASRSRTVRDHLVELKSMVPEDCEFVVPDTESDEELTTLAADADIILCVRLSDDVVRSAKKLRLIQKTGAGVDAIPFDSFKDRDIYVANTSGANAVPVAEHAFALILALSKRIVPRHNKLREEIAYRERSIELKGKTLGILGLGNIGIETAKRALAFDMKIVAIKRHPSKELEAELGLGFLGGPDDLERILRISDFLVITLPLTSETKGLIGEKELRMMKPSAFLVNVARAAIVEEEALYRALKEKWIAGAGLDVWHTPHWWDPIWQTTDKKGKPSRFPVHTLDNVVVTPHVAGSIDTPSWKTLEIIAENISRISRGEEPINQVDRTLRY